MDTLTLRVAGVKDPAAHALIETHFALMRSQSPAESCHVLPADALEGQFLLLAEERGIALGIGALVEISAGHGEIKSMHTVAAARGKGVGRAVLLGLMAEARARVLTRLSLETGSADSFAPARGLYLAEGFELCPPFGSYREDPLSVFMTRKL